AQAGSRALVAARRVIGVVDRVVAEHDDRLLLHDRRDGADVHVVGADAALAGEVADRVVDGALALRRLPRLAAQTRLVLTRDLDRVVVVVLLAGPRPEAAVAVGAVGAAALGRARDLVGRQHRE